MMKKYLKFGVVGGTSVSLIWALAVGAVPSQAATCQPGTPAPASTYPGTAVMATIGSEPFLLGGKGDWAWSRSAAQRTALLDATRYGSSLRIIYRDTSGRRVVDHYALGGAATAIDAAAASCAGKSGLS